jgi:hypothetical protein
MLRAGAESAIDSVSVLLNLPADLQSELATRLVGSAEESLVGVVSWLTRLKNGQPALHCSTQQAVAAMMGMSRAKGKCAHEAFGNVSVKAPRRESGTKAHSVMHRILGLCRMSTA